MPWSRSFIPSEATAQSVMDFEPQKFELSTPESALQYLKKKHGSDFRMNECVQVQTGVDEIERMTEDERIEKRTIELLESTQKEAYEKAYEFGLQEGTEKAFKVNEREIKDSLAQLQEMIHTLTHLKSELLKQNEVYFMKLLVLIASRIAAVEIKQNNETLHHMLKEVALLSQAEEDIKIEVHPSVVNYVESLRSDMNSILGEIKNLQIFGSEKISRGGCIASTNYGEIDSRLEARVEQMWKSIEEVLPAQKDEIKIEKKDES